MSLPPPAAVYRATFERLDVRGIPVWRVTSQSVEGPAVIVLHGLTSRKERHLELCLELAEAGFRAWMVDLRSHGERRDADSLILRGARTAPEFGPAFVRCSAGSAEDIVGLADDLGVERYGIIGHSFGGYIALQTALRDQRAAVIVNISGSIDASGSLPNGLAAHNIVSHAHSLAPRPILLLHGTEDHDVPITGARTFHAAFTRAYGPDSERTRLIEYPGTGHELLPEMRSTAIDWMQTHL